MASARLVGEKTKPFLVQLLNTFRFVHHLFGTVRWTVAKTKRTSVLFAAMFAIRQLPTVISVLMSDAQIKIIGTQCVHELSVDSHKQGNLVAETSGKMFP